MSAAIEFAQPLPSRGARAERRRGLLVGALGGSALVALVAAGLVLAAGASTQRLLFFVPGSLGGFPQWMRGPLSGLHLSLSPTEGALVLVVMSACYVVVLAAAPRISARVLGAGIVALHGIFLLAPPLFSADVFGYIDYARLGAIHGLNPYAHGA
ncbi:MAG: alpha,6-mannosyltransferase, partial [Solirubrobacteraceae bacterium]|nr:alpha,6-mannosyltransferase [Solirubrobacteraceae bacterium]